MQDSPILARFHESEMNRGLMFADAAHHGQYRLRPNEDGTPREYMCHPMEVAFIFAKTEIAKRSNPAHKQCPSAQAVEIIRVVERASKMSKGELKRELVALAGRLNAQQLTIAIGLLLHDSIETSYNKNTPHKDKVTRSRERRSGIRNIRRGVQAVVSRLTDSRKHVSQYEKHKRQLRLAANQNYASLKGYDMLANMFDEVCIPDAKRDPVKKLAALNHMHRFMKRAHAHQTISLPMRLAAERIYNQNIERLAFAPR